MTSQTADQELKAMSRYVPVPDVTPPADDLLTYYDTEQGCDLPALLAPPPFRADELETVEGLFRHVPEHGICLALFPKNAAGENPSGLAFVLTPEQAPRVIKAGRLLFLDVEANYSHFDGPAFRTMLDSWDEMLKPPTTPPA